MRQQSEASGDEAGKLGQTYHSGYGYYLWTLTWGFGWVPLLLAVGGAVWLAVREWRLALVLAPTPLVLLLFLGGQERYWARWLLPAYPLLCLLAAAGAVALRGRRRVAGAPAVGARRRLGRDRRRGGAAGPRAEHPQRPRADAARHARAGSFLARRPYPGGGEDGRRARVPGPVGDGPGAPVRGDGQRQPLAKMAHVALAGQPTARCAGPRRVVKLEDYERTTRPQLVDAYVRAATAGW